MTQEERWMAKFNEVIKFIEDNKRNPSKYVDSERGLRNWVKQQKKRLNAGELKEVRIKLLNQLLEIGEIFKRKNQYV